MHENSDPKPHESSRLQRDEFDEEVRLLLILGRYFGAFYHSTHDWLVRRVDTIEMVDSSVGDTATKTSLTIDGRSVARMRADTLLDPLSEVFLPLPATPKQLLGHFDARYEMKPVPVLSSIDNAHAAVGILLCELFHGGIRSESVQPRLVDFLYEVASCRHSDHFYGRVKRALDFPAPVGFADPEDSINILLNLSASIEESSGLDATARFFQMLDDYLENFASIAVLEVAPLYAEFVVKTYTISARAEIVPDYSHSVVASPIVKVPYGYFLVMIAVMALIDLSMTIIVGFALVVAAYLLDQTVSLSMRGIREFNLATGAFAYKTYIAATTWCSSLGLSGCFRIESSYTNLGLYGSQHYRLSIPEGARALDASIRIGDGNRGIRGPEKQVIENWVAAHYTNVDAANTSTMSLSVLVLPKSQALLKQSFYAALTTVCVLFAGLVSHLVGWLINPGGPDNYGLAHLALRSSGSIVTIIMIAPSVYTIILLQQNEHRFVSRLLRTMRNVVGLGALICASVAVPIGLDLPTTVVIGWWTAGLLVAMFSCWHIAATRYYHGVLAMTSGDPE